MAIPKSSVESQLRTRCNILESQVKTLEKRNLELLKENVASRLSTEIISNADDNLPFKVSQTVTNQWKEIEGVGKFPVKITKAK